MKNAFSIKKGGVRRNEGLRDGMENYNNRCLTVYPHINLQKKMYALGLMMNVN